jgi:hypothetical protein
LSKRIYVHIHTSFHTFTFHTPTARLKTATPPPIYIFLSTSIPGYIYIHIHIHIHIHLHPLRPLSPVHRAKKNRSRMWYASPLSRLSPKKYPNPNRDPKEKNATLCPPKERPCHTIPCHAIPIPPKERKKKTQRNKTAMQRSAEDMKYSLRIPHAPTPTKRRRRRYGSLPLPLRRMSRLRRPHRRTRSGQRLLHIRRRRTVRASPRSAPRPASLRTPSVVRRHGRARSVFLLQAAALYAAPAAAEDGEEDEAADAGGEADDEGLVGEDPVFYFVADGAAGALALFGGVSRCTLDRRGGGEVEGGLHSSTSRRQRRTSRRGSSAAGRSTCFRTRGSRS